MYSKEDLIDALDSVTWYNGLAEYVYQWIDTPLLKKHENTPDWLSPTMAFFDSWPKDGYDQLQVIWMICVTLFGDYGTSPRSGWIEKSEEFYQFCMDITKIWRESDEFQDYINNKEEDEEMAKKRGSIPISEKYGLNPTIPLCFWCGGNKNDVILLGKLKGDTEAPMTTWVSGDYEPCEKCREKMNKGIVIAKAQTKPLVEGQLPYHGAYPTGDFLVLTEKGIRDLLEEEFAEAAIKNRMIFAEQDVYSEILRKLRQDCTEESEGEE